MKTIRVLIFTLTVGAASLFAQTNPPPPQTNYYPAADPLQNISQEATRISKAVQTLNAGIKELLEKFLVGKGMQLNERQQKLLLGFEVLNRAEQRLEILQKFQIELTQKEGEVKTRLGQVEEAMSPDSIERGVALTGSTRGEEMRENRRQTLDAERKGLQNVLAQIRRNLTQTNDELKQAEFFVNNLRKKVLPQIEAEISDL